MAKKISGKRAPKTLQVRHVHVIFIALSVLILAVVITTIVSPTQTSGVLGTMIARGPGSDSDSDGSRHGEDEVDVHRVQSDAELSEDGQSHPGRPEKSLNSNRGRGNGKPGGILQGFKDAFTGRGDRRASESGDEDNGDDISVASESGEPVKLKKNRKEKILVLPQQAVAALLRNGIIQQVASGSGSASDGATVIFKRTNGTPVYVVAGTKEEKLFGAIPVNLNTTVEVSAETGEVVSKKESFMTRVLDFFSF